MIIIVINFSSLTNHYHYLLPIPPTPRPQALFGAGTTPSHLKMAVAPAGCCTLIDVPESTSFPVVQCENIYVLPGAAGGGGGAAVAAHPLTAAACCKRSGRELAPCARAGAGAPRAACPYLHCCGV